MGLFDIFKSSTRPAPPPPQAEPTIELTVTIGDELSRFSLPVGLSEDGFALDDDSRGPRQDPGDCWIAPGREVTVAGHQIGRGLFYLGNNLAAADSKYLIEPSLVNSALEAPAARDASEAENHYWPSYESLSPQHRGGYLAWLAGPRRAADAAQSYLFIYFYGLERRLLSDPDADPTADSERPAIFAELRRLGSELDGQEIHEGFEHHLSRLLDFLVAQDVLSGASQPRPPREQVGWEVPMTLRLMIGELAKAKLPLPAELAVSWILTSPEAYLRTPAERCAEEFAELFEIRYRERFGEGLELPGGPSLELTYRPASQGLSEISEPTGLPDLADSDALIVPLRELGRDCCSELDGLSRWLGRNPDGAGSFKAAALLPTPLLAGAASAELDSLRAMLARATAGEAPWSFDLGELIELWSPSAEKLPKKESVMAIQLIEGLGYGVEPDQRFGGPSPRHGMTGVLFESKDGDPRAPSPAYATASLLLHLQAAVAAADGSVSPEEAEQLEAHIHGVEELYAGERTRLHAHAQWLTLSTPKLSGLRKKLEPLSAAQRGAIGGGLVALAAADGEIDPEEVKVLSKVYGLLDLDPESVYSTLHAATSGEASDGPVVVREGGTLAVGHPIPPEREAVRKGLNRDAIDQKIEETALVSTLLAGIFEESDDAPARAAPEEPGVVAEEDSRGALSGADLAFARKLSERDSWPREEVEALAAELELLVDGALESVNDAAFELCDSPLCEGEDPIEIDTDTAREMLG